MLCVVTSDSLLLRGLWPTSLLCPGGISRLEYWTGLPCPPPVDLPNSETEPRSPLLQVDSLPSDPQGKPKNTGVGCLSLLQGIFLTQELNLSLQVDSLPAKLVQLNVVEWRNIFYLLFYMTKRWILYSFVIWRVCVFICLNNTILTLLFFFSKIMIAEEMEEKFIYIYVCVYIYIYRNSPLI